MMPERLRRSADQPDALRVLFIGNSFTARNDVPGMIERMAAARGRAMEHRLISAGGASLRQHWNKGDAVEAIRSGTYDVVVLQEQSTLPIKGPARMRENIMQFHEAIESAGARTVLYVTWARLNAPQSQDAITGAYVSIAKEIEAEFAPAGEAWRIALSRHADLALHDKDGSHPTPAGSFLAACTLYATILRDTPLGIDVTNIRGLNAAQIQQLQQIAAEAVALH
jgi:hypothetical protein